MGTSKMRSAVLVDLDVQFRLMLWCSAADMSNIQHKFSMSSNIKKSQGSSNSSRSDIHNTKDMGNFRMLHFLHYFPSNYNCPLRTKGTYTNVLTNPRAMHHVKS
jgi:hypothetical protein